jgi:hypothetical protein
VAVMEPASQPLRWFPPFERRCRRMECKSSGVLPHSRDFGLWSRRSGRCPLWLEICASPETALAQVVFRPLVLRRSVQAACSKRRLFFICMSLKVQEVHEIAAAAAAPGGAPVPWELGAGSQPGETPGARPGGGRKRIKRRGSGGGITWC